MATKIKWLRKQCEDAKLLHKKSNSYKGSYLYWCTHTTPFRGVLENDEIITNFISEKSFTKGVDYAIDAEDFEKILKKSKARVAKASILIECLTKFEVQRNLEWMKFFFIANSMVKFVENFRLQVEKHPKRISSAFLFTPSSPVMIDDVHPIRVDFSECPDCCVDGCELEGLHLRSDPTSKTNPKYFCNKHKRRVPTNSAWVQKPEGGYF